MALGSGEGPRSSNGPSMGRGAGNGAKGSNTCLFALSRFFKIQLGGSVSSLGNRRLSPLSVWTVSAQFRYRRFKLKLPIGVGIINGANYDGFRKRRQCAAVNRDLANDRRARKLLRCCFAFLGIGKVAKVALNVKAYVSAPLFDQLAKDRCADIQVLVLCIGESIV